MTVEGILQLSPSELSEAQEEFVKLHKDILYCGTQATTFVLEMARRLKEMRDGKHYLAAGFSSFGEYTEQAVNIKERQAKDLYAEDRSCCDSRRI